MIQRPLPPLHLNILGALKRSSIGLDLYMRLNYRTFGIEDPIRLYLWLTSSRVTPKPANEGHLKTGQ